MIRIVLAEVPGLLAELISSSISTQSGMVIVKEVDGDQDLDAVVMEADAHAVVTSLSSPHVPLAYQRLLFGFRHVALVAISSDGHYAEVYERRVMREVAVEQLVQIIRDITQRRAVPGASDNRL